MIEKTLVKEKAGLVVAGREFRSRLIVGTGKYKTYALMKEALEASGADMVTVALLKPDRMGTVDLYQYIRHLDDNKQVAQLYEIQFWKKVFYPLSCIVMLVLALPFAYLHFRSGGITAYVFGGVMVGISFFVLNNIFDYFGNLLAWNPLFTAAAPSMVYLLLSLVAFSVLVFKR